MSLAAKLNKLSSELSETKIAAEKEEKAKALVPVKDKIKNLEGQKSSLELIYNSLVDQSDKKDGGLNMPEYAQKIKKDVSSQEAKLDQLVTENAEVLEAAGVKNRQDLLDHPDFSEEEEVATYKESLSQTEDLVGSDEALRTRLSDLGIELGEGEASYQAIAQAVSEKMKLIDKELMQEKIKVPEFRQEVVGMLANNLEKKIPSVEYIRWREFGNLIFGGRNDKIQIINDDVGKAWVWSGERYWVDNKVEWMPVLNELKREYGSEVVSDALRLAWRRKIEHEVNAYESQNSGDVRYIKQSLEVNLAKQEDVQNSLIQLQKIKDELRVLLKSKQEELQMKNNIYFDFSYLDPVYEQTTENLLNDISKSDIFPPKYDYPALEDALQEKLRVANTFMDEFRAVKSEAEGNRLDDPDTGVVTKLLPVKSMADFYFKWPQNSNSPDQTQQAIDNLTQEKMTNQRVIEELNKRLAQIDLTVDAISGQMNNILLVKEKEQEYARLAEEFNFNPKVSEFKRLQESLLINKDEALKMISDLNRMERVLNEICETRKLEDSIMFTKGTYPDSPYRILLPELEGLETRYRNDLVKISDTVIAYEKELSSLQKDMGMLGKKPNIFSASWEKKQQAIQAEIDKVVANLKSAEKERLIKRESLDKIFKEQDSLKIERPLSDDVGAQLFDVKGAFVGKRSEVFQKIKDKLTNRFVDAPDIPVSLKKIAEEREKLIESIF